MHLPNILVCVAAYLRASLSNYSLDSNYAGAGWMMYILLLTLFKTQSFVLL